MPRILFETFRQKIFTFQLIIIEIIISSVPPGVSYVKSYDNLAILQGDLTEEADSNLYVNPLEAAEKCGNRVKKSASGEVGRNVNDVSPSVESLKDVRPLNEGSKITLNDAVPKHRKIRIQQVCPTCN